MYLDLFFLSCRKIVNAYMLQVRLDDGTVKDINCEFVRMLPATFLLRREAGGGGGQPGGGRVHSLGNQQQQQARG